jgi:hypothetical protein
MEQTQHDNHLAEADREELHLLYTVSASDIAGFKQQQWSVTNHALAIQAALVAVGQLLKEPLCGWERWMLVVLVGITAVVGGSVLVGLHRSIEERRERLRRIRAHFGKPFSDAWSVCKQPDQVHVFLALALVIAALVASWLVVAVL